MITSRRTFLRSTIALPLASAWPRPEAQKGSYTFLLLGDVHFDRLAHHDMDWLRREKPADVEQVDNYTRLTREVWPGTLSRLRAQIESGPSTAGGPVALVAQLGDLIEGLCGMPALAERQAQDVVDDIRTARLDTPFLFCKGNHDITGPGAREAFERTLLPFVRREIDRSGRGLTCVEADGSNFAVSYGGDWFLLLDAYDRRAPEWLARTLAKRTARHVFVFLHPPVVPYGARSTWIVLGKPAETEQRQRLVELLGEHRAFVMTGHIHKYATVTRHTNRGQFVQLALSSVIPSPRVTGACQLAGVSAYTPAQVSVEPTFSPETESDRRAVLAAEARYIRAFEYGDVPGFASISIAGADVRADFYAAHDARPWRSLDLVSLRDRSEPRRPA